MTDWSSLTQDAATLLEAARKHGLMIATAESCTGGLIIGTLTEVAGSSDVVDRGFVTYSNAAKMDMLGVREETLARVGAVSRETAIEMAEGALSRSNADLAVAVTGIAGPGGGSEEKPVGTVYLALARKGRETQAVHALFNQKGRDGIRLFTIAAAFELLSNSIHS
ncbi:CinA family protein [Roseibium suaedae]|uniref:Nicotinamide-nucleotide amidase n=1 Tax=Roseibium suaedae TaxID=735517 RepID=A0A1M7KSA1_9HYPH|nr:CinA family protein [Roseibium suaedae]SHM68388.1 nicotinamide-nucleotide amidase [Roseibium suaedae]